jgi:hypothetical protein
MKKIKKKSGAKIKKKLFIKKFNETEQKPKLKRKERKTIMFLNP